MLDDERKLIDKEIKKLITKAIKNQENKAKLTIKDDSI